MISQMISYASPDTSKVECVRVASSGLSLRATGYIVSTTRPTYGASFSVVVDAEGRTKRFAVRCDDADGERSVSLTRSAGGPWIAEDATGSTPQPDLVDAVDVYLSGSAFSASLPIRRLGLHQAVGSEASVTVASINLPDLTITALQHRGHTEEIVDGSARIAYSGSYGRRNVWVDPNGILLATDGLVARVG